MSFGESYAKLGAIRASGTYYNGAYYTVDFLPDVNSSSGLIFYEVVDRKNTFERVDQIVSELFKGVDRNSLSNGLPGYVPFRLPIIPWTKQRATLWIFSVA